MGAVVSLKVADKRKISLSKIKAALKEVYDSLEHLPVEQKVDVLAHIRSVIRASEKIEENCCTVLKRQRKSEIEGVEFIANRIEFPTERLDVEAIRADMSEAWIEKYTIKGETVQVRTRLKGFLEG